ncbi:MAG: phosphotransferase, partial [Mycobacterium sp.]
LHALLCGPNLPTVAVADFEVPLPTDPWAVHTDAVDFTHSAVDPLRTYRVTLRGHGESHSDPAALLRAERGTPAEVVLDLEWTTDGTPYQYRIATRYEIPCTVSGSVIIDGQRHTIDSVPGQRDHSWGVRDWWSMDWLWSALHLDDGTHVHAVDIQIPGIPPVSIGYVQDAAAAVTEVHTIARQQTFTDDGLPLSATLVVDPGGVTVTADVRGHAPLRLVSQDRRISQFPRVWATVATADGRTGVGWLEWNRNQSIQ